MSSMALAVWSVTTSVTFVLYFVAKANLETCVANTLLDQSDFEAGEPFFTPLACEKMRREPEHYLLSRGLQHPPRSKANDITG